MPVSLNLSKRAAVNNPDMSKGVPLELTDEQKRAVVLTKYISTNPLVADWQPNGLWWEQVISDVGGGRRKARITIDGEYDSNGDPKGVTPDKGLIIDLHGTLSGVVGILPGRAPMSESEIEEHFDATSQTVPMYQKWDFRVAKVLVTNGPELRENLSRTEEQKRLNSQTEMFDAFIKMFQMGGMALQSKGDLSPSAQSALAEGAEKVSKLK